MTTLSRSSVAAALSAAAIAMMYMGSSAQAAEQMADLIVVNGRITTLDTAQPTASALAVRDGLILAVGSDADIKALATRDTQVINARGRRIIPGLNDSHVHLVRGGLTYNLELRWDGVPTLKEALARVRDQARRTPSGQWVRVVGGWSEFQFAERRLPTLDEINAAAPDTPVFILYMYGKAFVNRAGLKALGITRETPEPAGGQIGRDASGEPTGVLLGKPGAAFLRAMLDKAPLLSPADQINSTRHLLKDFNRFGLTSIIDASGGGQFFPDDYAIARDLAQRGELTLRVSYNASPRAAGKELEEFTRWRQVGTPGKNEDLLRPHGFELEGAGERLVTSASDFENFLEPRPEMPAQLEPELAAYARELIRNGWSIRIHATYDETLTRILDVFEALNREMPFRDRGVRFFVDHAETASLASLDRIKALGGGVAVQNRLSFQGEHFVARYGAAAAENAPPIKAMLAKGIPVGLGTDATRVSTYNPWVSLEWAVSGKTVGGLVLKSAAQRLTREEALRLYTVGSAWFSGEDTVKGRIAPGQYADFAVLSADYFTVPEDSIDAIESLLTVVNGRIVYGAGPYRRLSPSLPPVSPAWSPVRFYGGYYDASR